MLSYFLKTNHIRVQAADFIQSLIPAVGSVEVPDEIPIPDADIRVETRKGVEMTYLSSDTTATAV